jgi:hypothetical protein
MESKEKVSETVVVVASVPVATEAVTVEAATLTSSLAGATAAFLETAGLAGAAASTLAGVATGAGAATGASTLAAFLAGLASTAGAGAATGAATAAGLTDFLETVDIVGVLIIVLSIVLSLNCFKMTSVRRKCVWRFCVFSQKKILKNERTHLNLKVRYLYYQNNAAVL